MPCRYKIDVLAALKAAGYNSVRLRNERLIGQRQIQQLRSGELVSWLVIGRICALLSCQPGDLVEYVDGADVARDQAGEET